MAKIREFFANPVYRIGAIIAVLAVLYLIWRNRQSSGVPVGAQTSTTSSAGTSGTDNSLGPTSGPPPGPPDMTPGPSQPPTPVPPQPVQPPPTQNPPGRQKIITVGAGGIPSNITKQQLASQFNTTTAQLDAWNTGTPLSAYANNLPGNLAGLQIWVQ